MQKLNLSPVLDAADFPTEVEDELSNFDVSTHYQSDVVALDWEKDSQYFPKFQKWLVETYGEEVKQYTYFAILAT